MQGKIYKIVKILGQMNNRTVMMERFQNAEFSWHCCPQKTVTIPRSVCVLLPNPRLSILFTHPTPVSPCLAQRGSDMRGSTVPLMVLVIVFRTFLPQELSLCTLNVSKMILSSYVTVKHTCNFVC